MKQEPDNDIDESEGGAGLRDTSVSWVKIISSLPNFHIKVIKNASC